MAGEIISRTNFPGATLFARLASGARTGAAMQWSTETRDGTVIGSPHGRVDEASWQAFGDHLGEGVRSAASASAAKFVINLAALDYMSSRGLRALTLAKREADAAGVTILLAAPNGVMREILAISRYDKLFTITDTIESAL